MRSPNILTRQQINVLSDAEIQRIKREVLDKGMCKKGVESVLIARSELDRKLSGVNRGYLEHSYDLKF